jgi:hypothetical protein
MSQRIDQFREALRQKMMQADSDLSELRAKIDARVGTAEREARACLEAVTQRIKDNEASAAKARRQLEAWVKQHAAAAQESLAALLAKGEKAKLEGLAEISESYAAAAAVVALAAIDEAERATLEAWITRRHADSAAN